MYAHAFLSSLCTHTHCHALSSHQVPRPKIGIGHPEGSVTQGVVDEGGAGGGAVVMITVSFLACLLLMCGSVWVLLDS